MLKKTACRSNLFDVLPKIIQPDHFVGIRLEIGGYGAIEPTQPKLLMKLILGKSYGILEVPVSRRQYDALVLPLPSQFYDMGLSRL
jgi:hypothetical protein